MYYAMTTLTAGGRMFSRLSVSLSNTMLFKAVNVDFEDRKLPCIELLEYTQVHGN